VPSEHQALVNSVHDQRDELERRYLETVARWKGARIIADGRKLREKREYPDASLDEAEDMALDLIRSDAFGDARHILEGLPDEAFGSHDRFVLCGVLEAARKDESEGYSRLIRQIWPSDE
jgi:hypothetical protein